MHEVKSYICFEMKAVKNHIAGILVVLTMLFAVDMSAQQAGTPNYDGCSVFAANAFTPNADGTNDLFSVVISENCSPVSYHLRIYDRWGRLVFESLDPTEAFNGTYDGQTLKEGVYLWRLTARYEVPSQTRIVSLDERGSVVLIR